MVAGLLDALARLAGTDAPSEALELDGEQLGPGYGVPTAAARDATELLARTEGILVDPVYTAKAMAGLIARYGNREFAAASTVLFWHTGGQVGLFA